MASADVDTALDEERAPSAPPVVAVVVTHDSGPWLEEGLAALDAQDYPNLSVLIIDTASAEDPTRRIAGVIPGAYVRRLGTNPGFGAACNEVLSIVEGASHFLFCHDDVALEPDALRAMVEEAYRSNAGIVSPKLVSWDEPGRLLQVGMSADKTGVVVNLVDAGELDQEQHDAVRDIFVAPSACMLVRADLFATLGGFDSAITFAGEDLDLSWRAQVVGARVVVGPGARVRHYDAMRRGLRRVPGATVADNADRLEALGRRHQLRTVLTAYGRWHLLRVLPQAALGAVAQLVIAIAMRHRARASAITSAWTWNLKRRGEIRAARAKLKAVRALDDGEVRRLQLRGSAALTSFARGHHLVGERSAEERLVEAIGRRVSSLRPDGPTLSMLGLAAVLLLGTRGLLSARLPAMVELVHWPEGSGGFMRRFVSGWNLAGLGSEASPPPAFGVLGLAHVLFVGAAGLAQKLFVLGAIPLGIAGAHRLSRVLDSTWARTAVVVVYALTPLAWNALAEGRLSGLVAYAALPWIVQGLARASGIEPFAAAQSRASDGGRGWRAALPTVALVGLASAFAPGIVLATVVAGAGIAIGTQVVGARALGAMRRALLAAAGGVVLLAPWSIELLLGRSPAPGGITIGELVRFQTGPLGAGILGFGFVLAAVLPVIVGQSWRLHWAAASWGMAAVAWVTAWVSGRGWLPVPGATAGVLLAPAAIGIAFAVGLAVQAFQVDLHGYHFGWRQAVSAASLVAVALGALPTLGAAFGGRWNVPTSGLGDELGWLDERGGDGSFRVLWIGPAHVLPLHGWRLSGDLAYGTTLDGGPTATDLWPGRAAGATPHLARAIQASSAARITDLGRVLAPTGVRYIIVAARSAPGRSSAPIPPALIRGLARQGDLRRIEGDPGVTIYENAAWIPRRAAVASVEVEGSGVGGASRARLTGATDVLDERDGLLRWSGPVPEGAALLTESPSRRWELEVAGVGQPRRSVLGAANGWTIASEGQATLRYRTPIVRYLLPVAQLLLWGFVAVTLVRGRLAGRVIR